MAVSSMTGFGRWETRVSGLTISVEIRTVNHRYLETSLRLPSPLQSSEQKIREIIQARLDRGRVTVNIDISGAEEGAVVADQGRVKAYLGLAARLKKEHGIEGDVDISTLLRLPDVLARQAREVKPEDIWPAAEKGLDRALKGVEQMRRREGRTLAADLRKRLQGIGKVLVRIEKRAPRRAEAAVKEMRKRVKKLLDGAPLNEEKIAQETAYLADRLDFTEEVVRARSHVDQFVRFLREGGAVGRKLNFLLQELHREVNTIGSKANDAAISKDVVDLKEEVERLREQVQNLE